MTKTIARAPIKAVTYTLRASEIPGCVDLAVEGSDEWAPYSLTYFQSRRKDMAPFPGIWKAASAADRRRLIAEVRVAA
jgi:hypothetical protein